MNAAAPEGTPPRRINDIKKFKRELRDRHAFREALNRRTLEMI
jgi:hypothetical protein